MAFHLMCVHGADICIAVMLVRALQICEPYFLKFGKSISFFLVLSYFLKFGKSISYFLKLVQSMLKLSRGVGEFVFAHVGYFLTKNAYVQPSKNSNDKIVSTHTKCVSLVEFHFSF